MSGIILLNNDSIKEENQLIIQEFLYKTLYENSKILQNLIPSKNSFILYLSKLIKPLNSFDIIVENERGFNLFGIEFFSSSILIPNYDPSNLTNLFNEPILNLNLFPLKNHYEDEEEEEEEDREKRTKKNWYIIMFNNSINQENDSDEKGWYYNNSFNNNNWKGKFKFLRNDFY